jgi:hypothetical protein
MNKIKKKYIVGGILLAVGLLWALSDAFGFGGNISTVKNGTFYAYPDVKIGKAFNDFFNDPEWDSYTDNNGDEIVKFSGECYYDNRVAKTEIFFIVHEDDTFDVDYITIGGDLHSTSEVLPKIFNNSIS